jgi:quercetin dioxygenase-like cupin family protein
MFVRKYMDVQNIDYMDGIKKRVVFGPKDGTPNYIMRVFEIAPGAQIGPHTHYWEHEGLILAGEGALISQDGETKVEAGNVYFITPNEMHGFVNKGTDVLRILCISPVYSYNASADPSAR